jgi:hypothetical protein
MTPRKLGAFRIKLRNELWKCFPRGDAALMFRAMQRIEALMVREAFNLVDAEHADSCACWHCLLNLHGEIIRHHAEMRAAREAAEDHD